MFPGTQIRDTHSQHPSNPDDTHSLILLASLAGQNGNPLLKTYTHVPQVRGSLKQLCPDTVQPLQLLAQKAPRLYPLSSCWHRQKHPGLLSSIADTGVLSQGGTQTLSHPAQSQTGSLKPPGYSGAGQPWSSLDPSISWHHGHTGCPSCGLALAAAVRPSCTQVHTEQGAITWGGGWRERSKTVPFPDRAQPDTKLTKKLLIWVWSFSSPYSSFPTFIPPKITKIPFLFCFWFIP